MIHVTTYKPTLCISLLKMERNKYVKMAYLISLITVKSKEVEISRKYNKFIGNIFLCPSCHVSVLNVLIHNGFKVLLMADRFLRIEERFVLISV